MRATLMYGAGDVRVETVPNPTIQEPTDDIVRIVAGCICGSDLWPYASRPESDEGSRMGHEFVGIVEELGSEVTGLSVGDFVIAPFVASDGTCDFCKEGLQTSCRHGAHHPPCRPPRTRRRSSPVTFGTRDGKIASQTTHTTAANYGDAIGRPDSAHGTAPGSRCVYLLTR